MKKIIVLGCALALSVGGVSLAADHLDSPSVQAEPAADINDVYAWTSADGTKLNLVMTVFPAATAASEFSDAVQYVFHTASHADGQAILSGSAGDQVDIICQFDASQNISCWVGDQDYATGDASATAGISGTQGMFRVFAGLRDDPFFFNLAGFNATVGIVVGAAAGLTFDDAGCPTVDSETSGALVGQLSSAPGGGAAEDFFAPLNTLSIVIEVDLDAVTAGGDVVSVWGSTRMRQ